MNVCVAGLWHLGSVTAACLASAGHQVVGLDPDAGVVAHLQAGTPPLFEPGLESLVKAGLASGHLRFSTRPDQAVAGADIVWIAYDTPVHDDDRADVDYVLARVADLFPYLSTGTLVLISSQLPVGTTRRLEQAWASEAAGRVVSFAYSPENLRLGKAIEVFTHPDRVVVGVRSDHDRQPIEALLAPITDRIEWMSVQSAEMTKHAINAFLATSVTFINEVATLCEHVGADAREVERGLKTEGRIGPSAYLSPGAAFAGGTLARDVGLLIELGRNLAQPTPLLTSIKASNEQHRHWAARRLEAELETLAGRTVAIWGLTYKPDTNTLRRSSAVELGRWLAERGALVRVFDPAIASLPDDLSQTLMLCHDPVEAVQGAAALVVGTPWPVFRTVAPDAVVGAMRTLLVIDAASFLSASVGRDRRIRYVTVGKPR